MKRLINTAIIYAILALLSGVVFREVTKMANYTDDTVLSVVHTHLLAMGMLVFLILVLFEKQFDITTHKRFNLGFWLYNIGLSVAVLGFMVRGFIEVYHIEITRGLHYAIAGIAGLGHVVWTVGILILLFVIKKQVLKK